MREIISNKDIGTTINFRSVGLYEAQHQWPAETVVSAGSGVASRRDRAGGKRIIYDTLFMEVYPPGAAFIRGEGITPEACEQACWLQYQRALYCTDDSGTHDWETRGYHNGAGFCTRCNTFGSDVFTAEQLGLFCATCQVPTMWHEGKGADGKIMFLCEEHAPKRPRWRSAGSDETDPVAVDDAEMSAAIASILTALAGPAETPAPEAP